MISFLRQQFIDYDGFGNPAIKDVDDRTLLDPSIRIRPSKNGSDIPNDATHIIWFNR